MSTPDHRWPVVGVVGGCGGAGASALCAALAGAPPATRRSSGQVRRSSRAVGRSSRAVGRGSGAGGRPRPPTAPEATTVLVDLDCLGGGIDVLLGAENSAGARWSGLHATGDRLDPDQLRDGLPRWWGVPFLACDGPHEPAPDAVRSVIQAARQLGPVIVDLGRGPGAARSAALADADAVVLLVPAEIRAVAAGAAQQASLDDAGFAGSQFLIARLERPVIEPRRMAAVLGLDLAGVIGIDRALSHGRDRGIEPHRLIRSTVALAREVIALAREAMADSVAVFEADPGFDGAGEVRLARDTARDPGGHRSDRAPATYDGAPRERRTRT